MSSSVSLTPSSRRPLRKRPPRPAELEDEDANNSESDSNTSSTSNSTSSKEDHANNRRTRHSARTQKPQQKQRKKKPRFATPPKPAPLIRRRSSRGKSSVFELANDICVHRKRVVFITGAGVSVASGVRPFRGSTGVWTQVIWTTATRQALRKDPLKWYNSFWLPMFLQNSPDGSPNNRHQTQYEDDAVEKPKPALQPHHPPLANAGHEALAELLQSNPNIRMITQNVDGLHPPSNRLIEAHGRLGLYKCLPEEDSDTDSDSDDDDEREVHLGHRRKRRTARSGCPYQQAKSLTVEQLQPPRTRDALLKISNPLLSSSDAVPSSTTSSSSSQQENDESQQEEVVQLPHTPKCPSCGNAVAPQALLFDEGYHAHDFYQFRRMEEWIAKAEVIVFCGTSFSGVTLTEVALEHAREKRLPVYNFNTQDFLESTIRLNAENVSGPSEETLPLLLQACREAVAGGFGESSASAVRDKDSSRSKVWSAQAMPSTTPTTSPIRVTCS